MYSKSIILIDGSNFYFKLKDLGIQNQLRFDFENFIKYLSPRFEIISSTYYIGAIRNDNFEKTRKLHAQQQTLLKFLSRNNIKYKLGYLLKSNGHLHEKGVDVNIAVDMLVASYENIAKQIFLVSSDTDLIPAIKQAQKLKKIVTYVGFRHKPSIALVNICDRHILLSKRELLRFLLQDLSNP